MKRVRVALVISLAVNVSVLVLDTVVRPLHAHGWGQGAGDVVNAVTDLAKVPGQAVAVALRAIEKNQITAAASVVVFVVNLGFYFGVGMWLARNRRQGGTGRPGNKDGTGGTGPSRRRFLRAGMRIAGAGAAGALGYSVLVEPRLLKVTRWTFRVADLPAELDGLRLVHLSDVHHGPWFSLARVRQAVARANELEGDVVVLTGDYVHRSTAYIGPVTAALGELRAKIGLVGVLGNHDWRKNGPLIRDKLRQVGIRMVDNSRVMITTDRRLEEKAEKGLCIAGVGDTWESRQDYADALGGVAEEMPRILVCHDPDAAEDRRLIKGGYRVDLMMCGHTHGGQVWIPGIGTPEVPSRYGQKYAGGLVKGPVCPVLISRGMGMAGLPVRFGVRPEIGVVELRRRERAESPTTIGVANESADGARWSRLQPAFTGGRAW